jgi:hypothetical protein
MQSAITNTMGARKLGYYLFWNIRQPGSGLAIDEDDVHQAAETAGLRHVETAWELFDRNCDCSATMEEVINAVEHVYENRKSLARTLMDNQTVVQQVENSIGIAFNIALLFIALAIFDAGAVQRTWTALSAGLLSFSFIFGNSIREVCNGRVAFVEMCLKMFN